MNFEIFFYYFFSIIGIVSAILVLFSKNPVHTVLFLILFFCNMTGLLLISEIEFLSIVFIIVYVGAVVVLFLFVIMMLDIQIINQGLKEKIAYIPISFFICFCFFIEIFILVSNSFSSYNILTKSSYYTEWHLLIDNITNVETIGQILYTYYSPFFLIAGIILLIALMGAVSLTMRKKKTFNQKVFEQLSRESKNAIFNTQ